MNISHKFFVRYKAQGAKECRTRQGKFMKHILSVRCRQLARNGITRFTSVFRENTKYFRHMHLHTHTEMDQSSPKTFPFVFLGGYISLAKVDDRVRVDHNLQHTRYLTQFVQSTTFYKFLQCNSYVKKKKQLRQIVVKRTVK